MVHTLADWTTKYRMVRIFANIDDAELAARLGYPGTEDRRGNVIWMDDFEDTGSRDPTIHWAKSVDGLGSVAFSPEKAWTGGSSMALVTDPSDGSETIIAKMFSHPIDSTMGAEIHVKFGDYLPIFMLNIVGYTGSAYWIAAIRYNIGTHTLEYQDKNEDWVTIPQTEYGVTLLEHWFTMKLVIDWTNKEYKRVLFGSTFIDMSGIPMQTDANATRKHIEVYLYLIAVGDNACSAYVDDFILTQNDG